MYADAGDYINMATGVIESSPARPYQVMGWYEKMYCFVAYLLFFPKNKKIRYNTYSVLELY